MQVADAAAGHKTQCPSCRIVVPVPKNEGSEDGPGAAGIRPEPAITSRSPLGSHEGPDTNLFRVNTTKGARMSRGGVQVRCPQCRQLMRASEGSTVNCPSCGREIEVSVTGRAGGDPIVLQGPPVPSFPPPGVSRASAEPSQGSSSTPSGKVGTGAYDGFAGVANAVAGGGFGERGEVDGGTAPPFSNPYAAPSSQGSHRNAGHPIVGGREDYVWQYTVNGIVFMLVGLFYLVSFVGAILQLVFALSIDAPVNADRVQLLPVILGFLITLPISVVFLLGGLSMVRQKSLGMARAVAILATIPPLNLCILFPFGIWATVLVFSGRSRSDFR